MSDVAHSLSPIQQGNPHAADELLPLLYDERRKLAASKLVHESPGQTLQATAHAGAALCPMSGRKQYLPLLFLIIVLAVFLQLAQRSGQPEPMYPQSFEDVITIAKKRNLQFRSDTEDGTFGFRLIVSRSPLTWMRANDLVPGRRVDSDWVGTVAVYQSWNISRLEEELDHVVPWGKLFLYGDRSLIKELTKQTDFDSMDIP